MSKTASAFALLAALALGACASAGDEHVAGPLTPTEHFPIVVSAQPEALRLAPHREGVSANQAQALGLFAERWSDGGGGPITLQSPARTGDPAAAYRTAGDAQDFLIAHGVAPSQIRIVGYDAGAEPRAPIIVGYSRYVAKGPVCGRSWENLTANGANRAYKNFGCALTANVATEIADPADLISPRQIGPADAARRQTVLDHYRKGETTSSAKDDQANGAVSTAVH